jgi:anti-anti-sigma factor
MWSAVEREPRTQFAVEPNLCSNGLRASVCGELDANVAARLFAIVIAERGGEQNLILDLAGVPFCDAAGIETLLRLRRRQSDAGGALSLVNAAVAVRRVIEVCGLATYFGMHVPVS